MIEALKQRAPDAVIVVVTYPREFPDTNCAALSMTDEELAIMQNMGAIVEDALVDAAERNDVLLADPYSQPGDHTGCAPEADQWAAGSVATDGFAYHPTVAGHQEMARLITEALNQ